MGPRRQQLGVPERHREAVKGASFLVGEFHALGSVRLSASVNLYAPHAARRFPLCSAGRGLFPKAAHCCVTSRQHQEMTPRHGCQVFQEGSGAPRCSSLKQPKGTKPKTHICRDIHSDIGSGFEAAGLNNLLCDKKLRVSDLTPGGLSCSGTSSSRWRPPERRCAFRLTFLIILIAISHLVLSDAGVHHEGGCAAGRF